MKNNDIQALIQKYFLQRLMAQRNVSPETIKSYRDTFRLYLRFIDTHCGVPPAKMSIAHFDADHILEFLSHLDKERGNSAKTINNRLAALHSFAKYLIFELPEYSGLLSRSLKVPFRKDEKRQMEFLTEDEFAALKSACETDTALGRRDMLMLLLLYNTGVRVSELVGLKLGNVHIDSQGTAAYIQVHGKGRKERYVPLWKSSRRLFERPRARREQQPPYPPQPPYMYPAAPYPQNWQAAGQGAMPPGKPKRKKAGKIVAAICACALVLAAVFVAVQLRKPVPVFADVAHPDCVEKPAGQMPSFTTLQGGVTVIDSRVKMLEINQALSYGFNTDTGEFYIMDKFVAGKETGFFLSFQEPVAQEVFGDSYLTAEMDGRILGQMLPVSVTDENTLFFQPRNMTEMENWPQGGYTFRFYIGGKEAASRTANFFDTMPLKVLGVPVLANYSGEILSCQGEWRNGADMLDESYPVAKAEVEYVLGPELDLSGDMYDLDDMQGIRNVWLALKNLQTPSQEYTIIIGFIPKEANSGKWRGYTYGLPATIVMEASPNMLSVVSHEIAHCYLIGDEYPGGYMNPDLNPPPYGMEGIDIRTQKPVEGGKPAVIGGMSKGLVECGSLIYPEQRAYSPEKRRLLGSVTSYMGWSSQADAYQFWTTSDIYNHLFNVFVGNFHVEDQTYWGQCPHCYSDVFSPAFYGKCDSCGVFTPYEDYKAGKLVCAACRSEYALIAQNIFLHDTGCDYLIMWDWFYRHNNSSGEMGQEKAVFKTKAIEITGTISKDGVFTPSPWFTYDLVEDEITSKMSGEYGVYFYGKDGRQLSCAYFDANHTGQADTEEGPITVEDENAPVDVIVKYPEGTARVVIMKDEQELYSVEVSAAAPQVSFTGLSENQKIDNKVTLTWETSETEGDLFFEIWYCAAQDDLYHIASNVTGRSYEADLSAYPGSDTGYFIIYATNGVLTGEGKSPAVQVPYKAPTILSEQKTALAVKLTEEIWFEASIYDMQDGWMFDKGISWTLDGKEVSHVYSLWVFPYELAPGEYTYTLTVTNTKGLSASKEFRFNIIDDESDLPDDWSRDDVKIALEYGFTLPLDRIDDPITRGEYANIVVRMLAGCMPAKYFPAVDKWCVKDCGNSGANVAAAHFMVQLGFMEAPGGMFEPSKPITQRDAALILFKLLATYAEFDEQESTEQEKIAYLQSKRYIDTAGPNAYKAAEYITRKQALVRQSRMFQALFLATG